MSSSSKKLKLKKYESLQNFQFHGPLPEETTNGLYFCDIYLPEEIVMNILSYIGPKEILNISLVCRKWCNIIKSSTFWTSMIFKKKQKKLPWYVYYCLFSTDYFDNNLIKNGNGQNKFNHWRIVANYGDGFRIEDPPIGADPLPLDVPEFCGKTSCFATSFQKCQKIQQIPLRSNRLLQLILDKFNPHIYLSDWVAGRFDCGCVYTLQCALHGEKYKSNTYHHKWNSRERPSLKLLKSMQTNTRVEQWEGSAWSKMELLVEGYPQGVKQIVFGHEGKDTQYWKGYYGSKMAGAVVKILFDSIEPSVN